MVAPPGPVSAEALKFTLVKPPAGPCTMTCVSTVSPRAPDREMEEAVPAASVFPTLIRLDCTHTGYAALDVWLAGRLPIERAPKTGPAWMRVIGMLNVMKIMRIPSSTATDNRPL